MLPVKSVSREPWAAEYIKDFSFPKGNINFCKSLSFSCLPNREWHISGIQSIKQ